jgi:hypothetical protein
MSVFCINAHFGEAGTGFNIFLPAFCSKLLYKASGIHSSSDYEISINRRMVTGWEKGEKGKTASTILMAP